MTPSTTAPQPLHEIRCVSPRVFYHELVAVLEALGKHTKPPVSLMGQLCGENFITSSVRARRISTRWRVTRSVDRFLGTRIVNSSPRGKTRRRVSWIDAAMTQLRLEAGSITSLVTPWRVS